MAMTYGKEAPPTDAQDEPEARELLRRAFEKTARWPADFKGFTADLTVNVDGKEITGLETFTSLNPSKKTEAIGQFQKGTKEHVAQADAKKKPALVRTAGAEGG